MLPSSETSPPAPAAPTAAAAATAATTTTAATAATATAATTTTTTTTAPAGGADASVNWVGVEKRISSLLDPITTAGTLRATLLALVKAFPSATGDGAKLPPGCFAPWWEKVSAMEKEEKDKAEKPSSSSSAAAEVRNVKLEVAFGLDYQCVAY